MGWVIHSDANSFYASVELLFRPDLRDKPVVVGGDEEARHGIVLTKNIIAKKFGIKTGVSLMEARKYCPNLVSLPPNYQLYLKYARYIREIYSEYSDRVQPFGLDEAWADISPLASDEKQAIMICKEIMGRVKKELGITVSIGLSWNKPYAKLGSDYKKPDALTVMDKENYKEIVFPLPASDLLFIGPATAPKLSSRAINTIGDVVKTGPEVLKLYLGIMGETIWRFASGNDITPVSVTGEEEDIKSIGNSSTFPRDLVSNDDVKMAFYTLAESVAARLRENGFECRTVQIHLRGNDLTSFERQLKLKRPTFISGELVDTAMDLFTRNYSWQKPLRSIGIRASDLVPIGVAAQLSLFEDEAGRERRIRQEYTVDYVRARYGYFSLQRGLMLRDRRLTSLDAKKDNVIHPVGYQYTK